jgi:RimJ/RimL family protein N-acetyltransferase
MSGMGQVEVFRTPRLVASRLVKSDLADCCRMNRNDQVRATLGGVLTNDQSRAWMEANLAHWDRHGFGVYFLHAANGQFVGRAGLRHADVEGMGNKVEVLYALMPEFWAQGLATEIARACIRLGFDELDLAEIVGVTLTTNFASQRVLEKSGLCYERDILHAGQPHRLYRIHAKPRSRRRADRMSRRKKYGRRPDEVERLPYDECLNEV